MNITKLFVSKYFKRFLLLAILYLVIVFFISELRRSPPPAGYSMSAGNYYEGNSSFQIIDTNNTKNIEYNLKVQGDKNLRKWNPYGEILMFVHIGKSGGTSLDTALDKSVLKDRKCRMRCVKTLDRLGSKILRCRGVRPIVCGRHFDWTLVSEAQHRGLKTAPILLLRNPIERTVSHFYFARTLEWTEGLKIREQTLEEYLNDTQSMQKTAAIWNEGESAANWLAGTHTYDWVVGDISQGEREKRTNLNKNWTYMTNTAISNLHQCLWFGILEEPQKSIEMLKYQTGLKIALPYQNALKHPTPDEAITEKLKALMPMDLYIYEYAKRLFFHRWEKYLEMTGQVHLLKTPKKRGLSNRI